MQFILELYIASAFPSSSQILPILKFMLNRKEEKKGKEIENHFKIYLLKRIESHRSSKFLEYSHLHHLHLLSSFIHTTVKSSIHGMSAYAALRAQDVRPKSPFEPPSPQSSLLEGFSSHSNFTPTLENTIYTSTSIFLGLDTTNHIVAVGAYELLVHRGRILVNNLHEIKEGAVHPIVLCYSQSPLVICATQEYTSRTERSKPGKNGNLEPKVNGLMPKFTTVIELRNLSTGLPALAQYCPPLKTMYYRPTSTYTFKLVMEPEDNLFAVFYTAQTIKSINALTKLSTTPTSTPESVVVIGSKNCGKSTLGKSLLNNMTNTINNPVAYMDLDPSNSEFSIPGTISVTVHSEPTFGLHFCQTNALKERRNKFCYYGFNSAGDLPEHYMKCCRILVEFYTLYLYPHGVPLIVNTPGWVRGLGKDFLLEITSLINPSLVVYLTHNDTISVGDFEAEEFESQDNPDDEVISGLTCKNLITLKATRIAPKVTPSLIKLHNRLTYFHHMKSAFKFDFVRHILFTPPTKLYFNRNSPESLAGICDLGFDLDVANSPEHILQFTETSLMGLCLVPTANTKMRSNNTLGPQVIECVHPEKVVFVCLCMVHSVNTKDGYINVYLPCFPQQISESTSPYLENGHRFILIRGEGEIPPVEILMPQLISDDTAIPYATQEPKMRIGGIWKARKNLGRKNQK